MKTLVLTTRPKEQLSPASEELKPWLKQLDTDIEFREVSYQFVPSETYLNGHTGISEVWMKTLADLYNKDKKYKFVFFYLPDFRDTTALGFFHTPVSTKDQMICSIFVSPQWEFHYYKEFKYDWARMFMHEILHALSFFYGIPDNTHKFQDLDNLQGKVDEIIAFQEKDKTLIDLLKQLVFLLTKKRDLLLNKAPCACGSPLTILHHSATARDWTRKETIERFISEGHKGWTWYNTIIGHNFVIEHKTELNKRPSGHNTKDLCVVGNFSQEQPNDFQKAELKKRLGDNWITHRQAEIEGIAEDKNTSCPGNLANYIL